MIPLTSQKSGSSRIQFIETFRGLACFLLVSHHVLLGLGLTLQDSFWYADESLSFFRMPLFTVISGYVYSLRPVKKGNYTTFLKGKVRRLMVPFLILNPIYFFLRLLTPQYRSESVINVFYTYLVPVIPLWYLQALLLIFILLVVLEKFHFLSSLTHTVITFACSAVGFLLMGYMTDGQDLSTLKYFSVGGAVYLLPFFLLGILIHRFDKEIDWTRVTRFSLLICISGFLVHQASLSGVIEYECSRYRIIGLLVSVSGLILLFRLRYENKVLSSLGSFSYSIYLYHMYLVAMTRIVLIKVFGVESTAVFLIVGVPIACVVPIIVEKVCVRFALTRFLFLGQRYRKNQSNELKGVSKTVVPQT